MAWSKEATPEGGVIPPYLVLLFPAICTTDPATRDQLAYALLLIREQQRHGGQGWIDYDRAFRQQAASDPSLRWNNLLPGLQAATILGQRSGQGAFCTLCRECDHTRAQCALAYLHPPVSNGPVALRDPGVRRRSAVPNVCISWNQGACTYPGRCSYRHVYATCQQDHQAKDCAQTPEGSLYKQRRSGNQPKSTVA